MNTFALRRVYAPRPNQRLFSFPVSLGCLLLTVVLFWLLFGRETLLHAQDTAQIPEIHFGAPLLVTDTMEGIHSVVAADLEGDGDLDLVAVSRLDGKVAWFRNDGGIRPALPGAQLATLDGAYAVQAADLNRDGIMDFVVAAVGEVRPSSVPDASIQTPTGKIVWFIGTSTSTPRYEQQVISEGLNYPVSIHIADLDHDGDLDLLSASRDDNSVRWFEHNGQKAPEFIPHLITNQAFGAVSVNAADMDGDGDLDILSASENDDQIAWYENGGGLPAQFAVRVVRSAGNVDPQRGDMAKSVFPVDVDGDRDIDILYALEDGNEVGWYENNGARDPAFTQHLIADDTVHVKLITAADVDQDGDIDVFSASTGDSTVALFENDGAAVPGWRRHDLATDALGARFISIADINQDGQLDVISASRDDNRLLWYPNQMIHRNAHFPEFARALIAARTEPRGIDSGDLDRDGDLDIVVVADSEVFWLENDGRQPPGFREHTLAFGLKGGRWPHIADLDGDGDLDVISVSTNDDTVAWYENQGGLPATFVERIVTQQADGPRAAWTADLDRDGDLDIYVASDTDDSITWYQNQGGNPPNFRRRLVYNEARFARSVFHADLDGDGAADLLSASQHDNTVAWYVSNGATTTPRFTREILTEDAVGVQHVSAADVDGDGDMDVLFAAEHSEMIGWLENRTDALKRFKLHVVDDDAPGAHAVEGADLDQDGDMDLIGAIQHDNSFFWYENIGGSPPRFDAHLIYDKALAAHAIRTADVDGDGDLDILGISRDDGYVAWFENLGGQFNFDVTRPEITGAGAELVGMLLTHNGRAGDSDIRLATLELQFVDLNNIPLTPVQLNDLVAGLSLYLDTCCNEIFDASEDQRLMAVDPMRLSSEGRLTIDLIGDNVDVRVAYGTPVVLYLVADDRTGCDVTSIPVRVVLTVSEQTAVDGRYGTPLLAQSLRRSTGSSTPGDTKQPNYVMLNEFMADNNTIFEDPDEPGEFPDWIEIFNNGALLADLSGMYLTDDLSMPTQYRIPDGVTIEPFGHITFIADGDYLQGALHTNFRLDKGGESIGLFDVDERDNRVLDVQTFNHLAPDTSFGRYPDGGDEWRILPFASPGRVNQIAMVAPVLYMPTVAFNIACP